MSSKSVSPEKARLRDLAEKVADVYYFDPSTINISKGWNRRGKFTGIEELGRSMHANGQKQAGIVRKMPDGTIELVAGERRLRASLWIRKHLDPEWLFAARSEDRNSTPIDRLFTQLEENSGVPFTLLEKARLYADARELGATQPEIAARSQTTKQAVSQALLLIDYGAPDLLCMVEQETISATMARTIIERHRDDHEAQMEEARQALAAAQEQGKSTATPKHLPAPPQKESKAPSDLRFEFTDPPLSFQFNEHDVCTNPMTCMVHGTPKAWKIREFAMKVGASAPDKWHAAAEFSHSNGGGGGPVCSDNKAFATQREAWIEAWQQTLSRFKNYCSRDLPADKGEAILLTIPAMTAAFEAALDERLSSGQEDSQPEEEGVQGAPSSSDTVIIPDQDATTLTFKLYAQQGAPQDQIGDTPHHHETHRLVLVDPPEGIRLLHLLIADFGIFYGYRINEFERLPDSADHDTMFEEPASGLPIILGTALAKLGDRGEALLEPITEALEDAIARYYPEDESVTPEEPEIIQWVAQADPGAIERITSAPSTNRDGSYTGAGNGGGYVAPDKRLAEFEKIMEELAEKDCIADRVTAAELAISFIKNEASPATLKNYLLGKS